MSYAVAFELGTAAVGLASDLGLPTDVIFGGLFGDDANPNEEEFAEINEKLDALKEQIDQLEGSINASFFDAALDSNLSDIGEARQASSAAWLEFQNIGVSQAGKAQALEDASRGVSDMAGAITSLLTVQNGSGTPQALEEMFNAMTFSLSTLITVANTWSMGEATDTGYNHGGVMTYKAQVQAGIDALRLLEPAIRSSTEVAQAPAPSRLIDVTYVYDGQVWTVGRNELVFDHDFATQAEAQDFFETFLLQFQPGAQINYYDGQVGLQLETDFYPTSAPPAGHLTVGLRLYSAEGAPFYYDGAVLSEQIQATVNDYLYFYTTGMQVSPVDALAELAAVQEVGTFIGAFGIEADFQEGTNLAINPAQFPWYGNDPQDIDALIELLDDTIDGSVAVYNGIVDGNVMTGTGEADYLQGGVSADILNGGDGNDYLQGNAGNDTLTGGTGSDRYFAGSGDDTIADDGSGAGETDIAIFEGSFLDRSFEILGGTPEFLPSSVDLLVITIRVTTELAGGTQEIDTLTGIEFVKFDDAAARVDDLSYVVNSTDESAFLFGLNGNDTITGGDDFDWIFSGGGDDVVFAGGADDIIQMDAGNNAIDGGDGIDQATYFFALIGVEAYLNFGRANGGWDDSAATLANIENLLGSNLDDRLVGTSGANVLNGNDGNDILKGKGGEDSLFGASGDDKVVGGNQADYIGGGNGEDVLIGLAGSDQMFGGTGTDFIYGGRDNDIVEGADGADKLRGNLGNDTLEGGKGDDDLRGGGGNDHLLGGTFDDFLLGENGKDTLDGGQGDDVLRGGTSAGPDGFADTFVCATAAGGAGFDRVKDFENGIDLIDLSAFGFADFDDDVLSVASSANSEADLRLNFGGGGVLYLENFTLAQFDATDVLLA